MTIETIPDPPDRLQGAGQRLWQSMQDSWTFDARETAILVTACAMADQIARLEDEVDGQPATVKGRTNPLLVELRLQRNSLAQALSRLDVPSAEGKGLSASQHATAMAKARWEKVKHG